MVTSIPSTNRTLLKLAWTSVTSSNDNITTVCSPNSQLRTYAGFIKPDQVCNFHQHRATASQSKCNNNKCYFLLLLELHYRFSRFKRQWNVATLVKTWSSCISCLEMFMWDDTCSVMTAENQNNNVYSPDTANRMLIVKEYFSIRHVKGKMLHFDRRLSMNLSSHATNC